MFYFFNVLKTAFFFRCIHVIRVIDTNPKRKMTQLIVYVIKVQHSQHSVSLVESEKMHRARKRLLERECRENTRLIFQNGPHDESFRGP